MTLRRTIVVLSLLVLAHTAFAQPPAERPAANAKRAATVKAQGIQIAAEHVNVWFTSTLSRREVERVISRLDAAVAEAKQVIGKQSWQIR